MWIPCLLMPCWVYQDHTFGLIKILHFMCPLAKWICSCNVLGILFVRKNANKSTSRVISILQMFWNIYGVKLNSEGSFSYLEALSASAFISFGKYLAVIAIPCKIKYSQISLSNAIYFMLLFRLIFNRYLSAFVFLIWKCIDFISPLLHFLYESQ